jgi:hypothetical protein
VVVVQTVENLTPNFTGPDQPQLAQPAQVVGYRRLTQANSFSNPADMQLPPQQYPYNPHPAGISQCLKQFRKSCRSLIREDLD